MIEVKNDLGVVYELVLMRRATHGDGQVVEIKDARPRHIAQVLVAGDPKIAKEVQMLGYSLGVRVEQAKPVQIRELMPDEIDEDPPQDPPGLVAAVEQIGELRLALKDRDDHVETLARMLRSERRGKALRGGREVMADEVDEDPPPRLDESAADLVMRYEVENERLHQEIDRLQRAAASSLEGKVKTAAVDAAWWVFSKLHPSPAGW